MMVRIKCPKPQFPPTSHTVGLPSIIMEQTIKTHKGKERLDEDRDRIKQICIQNSSASLVDRGSALVKVSGG